MLRPSGCPASERHMVFARRFDENLVFANSIRAAHSRNLLRARGLGRGRSSRGSRQYFRRVHVDGNGEIHEACDHLFPTLFAPVNCFVGSGLYLLLGELS